MKHLLHLLSLLLFTLNGYAQLGGAVVILGDPQRDSVQFPLQMAKWADMINEHRLRYAQLQENLRRIGDAASLQDYLTWMQLHHINFTNVSKVPRPVVVESLALDWNRLNQVSYGVDDSIPENLRQSWRFMDAFSTGYDAEGRPVQVLSALPRAGGFSFQGRVEPLFRNARGETVERRIERYAHLAEPQDLYKIFSGSVEDYGAALFSEVLNHGALINALQNRELNQAELQSAQLSLDSAQHRLRSTSERLQASYYQFSARQLAQGIEAEKQKLLRQEEVEEIDRGLRLERQESAARRFDPLPGDHLPGERLNRLQVTP